MLTLEEFNKIPDGEIFAVGTATDDEHGINMSNSGKDLRWVAKKGYGADWVIYCHWIHNSVEWVSQHGDKVQTEHNIRKAFSCTDEVYKKYRH